MSKLINPPRGIKNMHQSDPSIKEELITLTLDKVIPDEEQPRKDFSNLEELAFSIKNNGQQIPIIVIPIKDGIYKIVDGERRFRAIKKLQKTIKKIGHMKQSELSAVKILSMIWLFS